MQSIDGRPVKFSANARNVPPRRAAISLLWQVESFGNDSKHARCKFFELYRVGQQHIVKRKDEMRQQSVGTKPLA